MSFSTNMTSAQVTLNSSALEHRPNGFLANQSVVNTSTTMGTVGASKKWTILGYTLSGYASGATGGRVHLIANGNKIGTLEIASSATTNSNQCFSRTMPYSEAPQIAATQTIVLQSDAAAVAGAATVQYIEESV